MNKNPIGKKIQIKMKFKKTKEGYVISIAPGENIIEQLKAFCSAEDVKLGFFTGIGAVDSCELAHYTVSNKEYKSKKFEEPLEVTNLTGNVTTMDDEVYLHCHATLSDPEMKAISGHFVEGRVSAACEIFLVPFDGTVNRKHSEEIGLNLLDL